jgi:hypothetical protein
MEGWFRLNPILRDVELRGVAAPPRVFEVAAPSGKTLDV